MWKYLAEMLYYQDQEGYFIYAILLIFATMRWTKSIYLSSRLWQTKNYT